MKTWIFEACLREEDDGRWSAWIPALPGCAAWGYTREQAMNTLEEVAEIFVDDMLDTGELVPASSAEIPEDHRITVTDDFPHSTNNASKSTILVFGNSDGRRATICYYDSDEDTLPPAALEELIRGTGWTENDARRLGLL